MITCGGVDVRDLDLDGWRSSVAWVPQHPTLFSGTIAENIALAVPTATDRQLHAAIAAAGLGELITSLPDGMQTMIGETGRRVSAGQRQRIALARAFLQDAPVLVLDEPTAHLDADSAAAIGATIERLARGRTTLLVVHHPSLAERAERIVRIAAGRIVAEPARLELVA